MWFKRRPVKMNLGDKLEIRVKAGGICHRLTLTEISVDSYEGTRVIFSSHKDLRRL